MELDSDANGALSSECVVNAVRVHSLTNLNQMPFDSIIVDLLNTNKTVLIDFWHFNCPNCIRTLPNIVQYARQQTDVALITCALGFGDTDTELQQYRSLLDEMNAVDSTGIHLFVDSVHKEVLKSRYNFSSVPYCISIKHSLDRFTPHKCAEVTSTLQKRQFVHVDKAMSPKAVSSRLFSTQEEF